MNENQKNSMKTMKLIFKLNPRLWQRLNSSGWIFLNGFHIFMARQTEVVQLSRHHFGWSILSNTHLKKSSLQKSCPARAKHLSARGASQSLHLRHLACQVLSSTFRMNRSRIRSPQPPHLGMLAAHKHKHLLLTNSYPNWWTTLDSYQTNTPVLDPRISSLEVKQGESVIWLSFTVKTKPPFWECYTCFGYETKTGLEDILVIFHRRPMFSHINGKLSARPFEWYGGT